MKNKGILRIRNGLVPAFGVTRGTIVTNPRRAYAAKFVTIAGIVNLAAGI